MCEKFKIGIIISFLLFNIKCSSSPSCIDIAPPAINLTGGKTIVERQIIGDYRELEKDAWVLSSVQTNVQKSGLESRGADPELFQAMQVREFHKKKIRKYKDEGVIGEGREGLIHYRQKKLYQQNKNLRKILLAVIEDENKARKIIFKRSVSVKDDKQDLSERISKFGEEFAKEQSALAQKNDWIQNISGKWVQKR